MRQISYLNHRDNDTAKNMRQPLLYCRFNIIQMFDFLIDSIFVLFGGRGFQETNVIPMGTLADLFINAYRTDLLQGLLKNKDRKLAWTFYSSFRYIDDVLSLNYSRLVITYIVSIQMSLKLRILQTLKILLLTFTFTLKSTTEKD